MSNETENGWVFCRDGLPEQDQVVLVGGEKVPGLSQFARRSGDNFYFLSIEAPPQVRHFPVADASMCKAVPAAIWAPHGPPKK